MARGVFEPSTKLARLRAERGISQGDLARVTGLSLSSIQRLERGPDNPRLRDLNNCAIALGVQLQDVLEDRWLAWRPAAEAPDPPANRWWVERYLPKS